MSDKIICWWSGGVTSAVACWIAIGWFGKENCRVINIDTRNEDDDTYRFMKECEVWYGIPIEQISSKEYITIQSVWRKNNSLNTATGAICSSVLKREVRIEWQKENTYRYQVFGFDADEVKRALAMKINYADSKPIFPLLGMTLKKKDCIKIIAEQNTLFHSLRLPNPYYEGYHNNNCAKTGCVQGGIGYWQKIQRDAPDKFDTMAAMEHELTDAKGEPVTICKDQGKDKGLVFLKPHPDYPDMKDLSMMKGREPEPLMECNGYCGLDDLNKKLNENEFPQYQ